MAHPVLLYAPSGRQIEKIAFCKMLKTVLKHRSYRITAIVFAIAFGVCWLAWIRFFTVAALNPSPVRYFTFVTAQGRLDPFRQECTGPAFAEGDVAWRFCGYDASARRTTPESGQWGLVRFDLTQGEAALRWPLPEAATAQILALAQSPAGDLATAWGSPGLSAVYLILREGGVVPLGIPQEAPSHVFGLAWDGQGVELVATDGGPVTILRNESGVWSEPRRVAPPEVCEEGVICALQVARRDPAGWRFLYAVAPVEIGDLQTAELQVVLSDEDGIASSARSPLPTSIPRNTPSTTAAGWPAWARCSTGHQAGRSTGRWKSRPMSCMTAHGSA